MTHTSWHFVRACDLHTKQLIWCDPSTNFVADSVTVARYGRTATPHTNY